VRGSPGNSFRLLQQATVSATERVARQWKREKINGCTTIPNVTVRYFQYRSLLLVLYNILYIKFYLLLVGLVKK